MTDIHDIQPVLHAHLAIRYYIKASKSDEHLRIIILSSDRLHSHLVLGRAITSTNPHVVLIHIHSRQQLQSGRDARRELSQSRGQPAVVVSGLLSHIRVR